MTTPPLICIDPGHGGTDPGAIAGGVRESDVALAYALELGSELARRGAGVLYTRSADRTLDLAGRVQAANEHGAVRFVSVHANASASEAAHGFQVFHAAGSAAGAALATAIHGAAVRVTGPSRWSGVYPDESPHSGGRRLYVLRATRMPAVLIELGFITHPEERASLLDPPHREQLARAIASAVAAHLGVT